MVCIVYLSALKRLKRLKRYTPFNITLVLYTLMTLKRFFSNLVTLSGLLISGSGLVLVAI